MWSYEEQNKTVLFDYTIPYLVKQTRLVIEFKNGCLKRCENCSLKSVIEIYVFSFYKTKKCVWYHGLNNMFQCSKI